MFTAKRPEVSRLSRGWVLEAGAKDVMGKETIGKVLRYDADDGGAK
jgi:hypothetical protein